MMIQEDYYDGFMAEWYDDWLSQRQDDIACYEKLFNGFKGRVLELACGTGRLLLPIAKSGTLIDGLDSSVDMLQRLQNKAYCLGLNQIHTFHKSMVKFSLPHKYEAIFIGGGSFQLLISDDDVRSSMESIINHLTDTGFFIVDVFIPWDSIHSTKTDVFQVTRDITRQDGSRSIVMAISGIDLIKQVETSAYKYEIYKDGFLTQSLINTFELRWYWQQQMLEMLKQAGFSPVEVLSSLPLCQEDKSFVFKAFKALGR